ncbi:MAG: FG-GAP-like repeat-containing protein [Hyphomicrobium sp.]
MDLTPVPLGLDVLVNTYLTSGQTYPEVASLADGGYLLTWSSYGQDGDLWGIFAQRYDAAGGAIGAEFQVNTFTSGQELFSSAAGLADGGFVVVWRSDSQDGSGSGIYGQIYDANSAVLGGEFLVNTFTSGNQSDPTVSALMNGEFVVTWVSVGQSGGGSASIYGQRFGADGTPLGSEFRVNSYTVGAQISPSIASLQDGGFVITWTSQTQDGSGYGVYGQQFDKFGAVLGAEFLVNTSTSGDQNYSSVTALASGGFVVTWSSYDGSGWGVYGQRYDALGVPINGEFQVNTFKTSDQLASSAVGLSDGGIVVIWTSNGQDGSGYGVYGQRFDEGGTAVGDEFRINETTTGSQLLDSPGGHLTLLSNGQLVATWSGGSDDVYLRLIDVPMSNSPPAITSDGGGDTVGLMVSENTTLVTTLSATDVDTGQTLTYSISGGEDAALFEIRNGNELHFINAPDYEALPADAGGAPGYQVEVQVSDGQGGTDTQLITVTVTNVAGAMIDGDDNPNFLVGTDEEDVINGYGGNDVLVGLGGNDVLNPGAADVAAYGGGFELLVGGAGNDTLNAGPSGSGQYIAAYHLDGGPSGIIVDLAAGTAADTFGDTDTLNGVTFVIATSGADTLIGGAANDIFAPGGGTDSIDGSDGNDRIAYSYLAQFGSDAFDYTIGITVNQTGDNAGTILDPTGATDTFTNVEEISGTRFTDTFNGSAFDDYFIGGDGADTFNGGDGIDTVDFSTEVLGGGLSGVTVNFATGTATGAYGETDTLSSIERVIGTQFSDMFIGGSYGQSVANLVFDGGDGDDTIISATMSFAYGGSGNDTITTSAYQATGIAPVLDGGSGDDTLNLGWFGWTNSNLDFSLITNFEHLTFNNSISNITLSDVNVSAGGTLTVTAENYGYGVVIDGSSEADGHLSIVGTDLLYGYPGNDTLIGGHQDDTLSGLGGNDILNGGDGNDLLIGGGGNDQLDGGGDSDTAVFTGNRADYAVSGTPADFTLVDSVSNRDGTDTIRNIEFVQFADGTVAVADLFNQPPSIAGGDTASISVDENSTLVSAIMATDPNAGQTLTYSISGGEDAALFEIRNGNELHFINAPDYEALPADAGGAPGYQVEVQVSDGQGGTDSQLITVMVADIDDTPPSLVSIVATDAATNNLGAVHYTVTFSEPVTGVDVEQFSLVATGTLIGASITSVTEVSSSNGVQYTVVVDTGSGDGTVALGFIGSDVRDLVGNQIPGGSFSSQIILSNASGHVTAADFNGDGNLDLVSETGTSTIGVFLSNGDGTFQSVANYFVGSSPNGISVSDLNSDGKLDIAVSNYVATGTVSVLLGDGLGGFGPRIVSPTGKIFPAASAIGDVNADGIVDILTANNAGRSGVSVLLGNNNGTFTPSVVLPSDGDPVSIALADINGDNIADVAFSNAAWNAHDVQIYLGSGDGTFIEAPKVVVSNFTYSVLLEDVDNDTNADLIFSTNDGTVTVTLGRGDGTFKDGTSYLLSSPSVAPGNVKLVDVDSDGIRDLVFANTLLNAVSVLIGQGDGTFGPAQSYATGGSDSGWLTVGDFTNDGRADVAISNFNSNSISVLENTPPTITGPSYTIDKTPPSLVSIVATDAATNNLGAVHYTVTFSEPVTGVDVEQFSLVATGALIGASITSVTEVSSSNGVQYTVVVDTGSGDGTVALGFIGSDVRDLVGNQIPGGTFSLAQTISGIAPTPSGISPLVVSADLNGDGFADLVSMTSDTTIGVLIANGDGTFQAPVDYASGIYPVQISLSDVNSDGATDIIVPNYISPGTLSVLLGNGDGTFGPQIVSSTGNQPSSVAIADFNGDGFADIAATNDANNGGVSILFGANDGTFTLSSTLASDGDAFTVSTADFNGDGFADIAFTNAAYGAHDVQVYLGSGDGTFAEAAKVLHSGGYTTTVLPSDLNGDGHIDLVYSGDGVLSVALGNGDGTFGSPTSYAVDLVGANVSIGDINGDGVSDIVYSGAKPEALYGNGDGTFQSAVYLTSDSQGSGWSTIADFTGDGRPDIAVAGFDAGTLSILQNSPPTITGPSYTIDKNDAPKGTDVIVLMDEDTTYTFTSADFGFSDPDAGDTLQAVRIDSLPINGTLTLAGVAVAAGQVIASTDVSNLAFAPAPDNFAVNYTSFTFSVSDGSLFSSAPNTLTVDVRPVNDLPVITSNGGEDTATVTLPENSTYITTVTASDLDLGQTFTYSILATDAVVQIDPITGVLTFNDPPNYEAPMPAHDPAADNSYSIVVQVSDGNGGVDTQEITVNVTDVNEAPRLLPAVMGANLISNGGFESGLADWTPTGAVDIIGFARQSEGSLFASFNNGFGSSGGTLSQTIETEPGKTYVIEFDAGTYGGNPGATGVLRVEALDGVASLLNAIITDTTSSAAGHGGSYSPYTYTFTATGTTTTIRFTDESTGDLLKIDLQLDNVRIHEQGYVITENTSNIAVVGAVDPDAGPTLTYSIVLPDGTNGAGADGAKFAVDPTTGALSFITTPDFEQPTDAGGDNIYDVTVRVSDGNGGVDTRTISVNVTNIGGVAITGTNAANTVNAATTVAGNPLPTNEEDFISGLGGADVLSGLGGNDTIDGGAGNDVLNGNAGDDRFLYLMGQGADTVDGGDGVDTLAITGLAGNDVLDVLFNGTSLSSVEGGTVANIEQVTADLLGGTNKLSYAGAGTTTGVTVNLALGVASGFTEIANIRDVTGGNFADSLTGDASANVLSGGSGDDILAGGLGADSLAGGTGNDTASYADESDAVFASLADNTMRRGSANATVEDTFSSIENLIGGSGDDQLIGGTNANTIEGGDGADVITGNKGNDILSGGAGDDSFFYAIGDGTDTVNGGSGTDTLSILGTTANDTLDVIFDGVSLTNFEGGTLTQVELITAALDAGTDTLTYAGTTAAISVDLGLGTASGFTSISGVENVVGGSGNDTLTGAAGITNKLTGGSGDDTFTVHDIGDLVVEASGGGVDTVLSLASSFTLSANVENLTFIGSGNFSGTGNGLNNVLTGGAGDDLLSGGGGDDRLIGGTGNDILTGGNGNDTFVFAPGFGNDQINGFDANPTGGQDLIDLTGFNISADTFAAHVSIADVGADTLVTVDGTDTILLAGIGNATTVTQQDFILI